MLQVKEVRKKYVTGGFEQIALDGVSLNLRDNEFVAILGPSGSGKTTLLNIIGGLDRYDSGDLIINGVSTKKYKDRDWDSYRNHTVGFVFQSYNLIPHQTVLQNVELALTIGGISSAKRKQMALDALEQVGLKEQAHKRPNQMSGGQMQRVAIARALVNNPKILLADEPTGALDTKTSVQVMDLLKAVAKDRLVVMVTHNPELAEEYANRIVRVKDGQIIDDSNPLVITEETPAVHKNLGKASMSILTSFGLSLNNLMTKKGRTFLTAFAGSIGIIGIALILSLSTGFQDYIDQIQEETMGSYPLTIYQEASDIVSAILTMHSEADEEPEEGTLVEQQYIESMMGAIATNDLEYFKEYLENHEEEYMDDIDMIKYSYSVSPLIYTIDAADNLAQINPNNTLSSYLGSSSTYLSSYSMSSSTFSEITDYDAMKEEYELLAGEWPTEYNELIAVVSDPNQISDLMLYSLGIRNTKELKNLIVDVMSGEVVTTGNEKMVITYDDLMNLELKLVNASDKYRYNADYDTYEDMSDDDAYMREVYDKAESLKIVGIAYSEDSSSMSAGIMYLPELTYYVIGQAEKSELVQKQLANEDVDVFSGKSFDDESEDSGLDFGDMISVDEDMISDAFQINVDTDSLSGLGSLSSTSISLDEDQMSAIVMGAAAEVTENLESVTQSMVSALTTIDTQIADGMIGGYKDNFTVSLSASDLGGNASGQGGSSGKESGTGSTGDSGSSSADTGDTGSGSSGSGSSDSGSSGSGGSSSDSSESGDSGSGTSSEITTAELADLLNENGVSSQMLAMLLSSKGFSSESLSVLTSSDEVTAENLDAFLESSGMTIDELASMLMESSSTTTSTSAPVTQAEAGDPAASYAQEAAGEVSGDSDRKDGSSEGENSETGEASGSQTGSDSGTSGTGESSASGAGSAGSASGEGTDYLMLSANGFDLVAMYKSQALSDTVMENLAANMSESMGMELSAETLQKVVSDAYDNYFDSITPNAAGMVAVSDLPDTQEAIAKAIKDNEALIFMDAYDMAKNYTTLMVAAGMGQAVSEVMVPVMSGLSESLSGLAGLSDLFSGDMMSIDTDKFAEAFNFDMDEDELSRLMESMMTGEDASYTNNLLNLGYQDLNNPTSIAFYFKDFETKNDFSDWLEAYNDKETEEHQLTYSDLTGILMGSVETIINSVTYVLIAFVSISLVVSSIMIGIITYISVLERTKEIGILRAIGASKRNISSIFNAETFIIGFLSGLIGVGATLLLNIPVNMIIHNVTNNPDITAVLEPAPAVVLVIISTVLTMIGGLIPSGSASRKDPVIALRTE